MCGHSEECIQTPLTCCAAAPQLHQQAPLPGVGAASRLDDPQVLAEVRPAERKSLLVSSLLQGWRTHTSGAVPLRPLNLGGLTSQVQHVSRQLVRLFQLLGCREDVDIVGMVQREPRSDSCTSHDATW